MNKSIDHIVYAVFDLDKAMDEFEKLLGIRPVFGGYHKTFGTKNALINLNHGMYLELLAADDDNIKVKKPRWMGIDVLNKEQITRWALKSNQLKSDSLQLKKHNSSMGQIMNGSRNTANGSLMKWELAMPLPKPEVELAPFMVDWSKSEIHPNRALPKMGCELIELYGTHPEPVIFDEIFKALDVNLRIENSSKIKLKMTLKSPNGIVEL